MATGIISKLSKKVQLAVAGAAVAGALLAALPMATSAHASTNCDADGSLDSTEQAFLGLINNYRQQSGLGALTVSQTLNQAAAWKSQDIAVNGIDRNHPHDDVRNGEVVRDFGQRLVDCGYSDAASTGEIIAAGTDTAQDAFDAWKASDGHNRNMLGRDWTVIGIGRVAANDSWFWTVDFGSQADLASQPTTTPRTSCADTDGDGRVLINDIAYVVNHFRSSDARADLNGNGTVQIDDVSAAVSQFRTNCDA